MNNWVGGGGIQNLGRIQGILHYIRLSSMLGTSSLCPRNASIWNQSLHTHMRAEHGIQQSLDTKFQGRN